MSPHPKRDRVGDLDAVLLCPERRQELVLDADAEVDGDARVHLPRILGVDAVIAAGDGGVQPDAVLPRVVAVRAACVDDRAAREALTPVDVEAALGVVAFHVVADPVERVTHLDRVVLPEGAAEERAVEVQVVPGEQVALDDECARHVREACRARVLRRHDHAAVVGGGVVHARYGTSSLPYVLPLSFVYL